MLVRNYQIKVTSPPCDPGSERWSAFASLEADIGEVLPYLNAVWPDAIYDHEARVLTRRAAGHAVAIRPHEVAVSNVLDRNDAERLVNELITEINGVWARRGEIVPQTTMRKRPTGMEIYKLLPKTNCRACGQPTCFTFALQVAAGSAELSQCPRLSARVGDAKAAFGADVGLELASHISQEGEAIRFVPRIRNRPWTKIGHILMILLFLMALSATLVIGSRADEGLVYLIYFYDPECSVCEETHRQVLEPLMAEYSSRIFVEERSVADSANFELMIKLEQEYKVMVGGIPEVFIGQDVLAGAGEITARLKERIEHYLAQGGDRSLPAKVLTLAPTAPASASSSAGCDVCEEGRKGASVTKSTPTQGAPVSQEAATAKAMIHAAYFYQPGCDECDRAEHDLEYIQGKYPQLQIRRFDVKEEAALNQYLCNQAQVPAEKHLTAPALFIGKSYLIGEQIRAPAVESLLAPYLSTGAPEPWAGWEARKEQAEAAIVERFRHHHLPHRLPLRLRAQGARDPGGGHRLQPRRLSHLYRRGLWLLKVPGILALLERHRQVGLRDNHGALPGLSLGQHHGLFQGQGRQNAGDGPPLARPLPQPDQAPDPQGRFRPAVRARLLRVGPGDLPGGAGLHRPGLSADHHFRLGHPRVAHAGQLGAAALQHPVHPATGGGLPAGLFRRHLGAVDGLACQAHRDHQAGHGGAIYPFGRVAGL